MISFHYISKSQEKTEEICRRDSATLFGSKIFYRANRVLFCLRRLFAREAERERTKDIYYRDKNFENMNESRVRERLARASI